MAGARRVPAFSMSYRRCTPVVVSSDRPRTPSIRAGNFPCMTAVRSPPSSRIMFGRQPSGPSMVRSMHHQNSSSVSFFHAKTGIPAAATAAAAWSWVEKMLHELHRTSAPSAVRVSMSTAVWMVMCRHPAMRAPARGCSAPCSERSAIRPGISVSAMAISFRPQSASVRFLILKSSLVGHESRFIDGQDRAQEPAHSSSIKSSCGPGWPKA